MADFLIEIGLEEIPARMIAAAQAELEKRVVGLLERERLVAAGAVGRSYSTPRRLAVLVEGVAQQQQDMSEELQGPSVKIAYKDGVATPAAVAFARKAGVAVEALQTVSTPKGEYIVATAVRPGRSAAEVIATELPKEIAGLYWPKNMYWRQGRPERFVRPVRWLLALLGEAVVPVEFAGYVAGSVTYGHRVLFGEQPVPVASPAEYADKLRAAFVIADVEARRHTIRKALDHATRAVDGLRWREDHGLVDKLTHLTEWASDRSVVLGSFEPEYLDLPEEVLVTVMRDHQSYFALEDSAGKLAPYFLAVLNTQAEETGLAVIRHGNARVLRARFNDARFFWEFDQRTPLTQRMELLKSVTFQKDLGSYAVKAERVQALAGKLGHMAAGRGVAVNAEALNTAAQLAKTDLTCELVKEFTELQGIVGGLYARAQGLGSDVADVIYDHYLPQSMDDAVPRTVEGALLAIADKADTIAGMFGLGLEPTGSKDPFALRRAVNGVVKILAESAVALPLTLREIAYAATSDQAVAARVHSFLAERLEFYLRDAHQQAYDVVKAVLASGNDDVRDAVARAFAVTVVRGGQDFVAVSAAFKRMKNILTQAAEKDAAPAEFVNAGLFADDAERALWERSAELASEVAVLRTEAKYHPALELIATLRPQVDAFFDAVMVMAPEPAVRANRLALLREVLADFSGIADFSEIVVAG
ncbi:MAG: glycine--tRNA ligase subunit beta [Acidobacteriota bacterium]|nr:glycine--tRNA ligase subunit beta [Acidobacteriota bacterium]